MAMPSRSGEIPQGLKVMPDGSWRIGELQVIHPPTLRYLKSHLVFEDGGAFVADGARGAARAVLDDGSEEPVRGESLGMDPQTGRFHCVVREGRAQAVLSRGAHQTLLAHAGQEGGQFFLQAGERRLPVRA